MELFEAFRARYPFPLDDFQVEACRAIAAGQSVIVSAPTGAGKTLVAEFAIYLALARGQRVAYTTPLKALSNQKFADFGRAWGEDHVGILTGDVKVNPQAPVLVMTTEILRNLLYAGGLRGLGWIVLDECHYMGDEGRGTVWEEIIVNAPPDVPLVALSATVANVREIADWISLVHRPIVAIYHPHRPVPLTYALADLAGDLHDFDKVRSGQARIVGDERRPPDERSRWLPRRAADPETVIEQLEARGWLPAIYFIFSRAGCERALEEVLAEGRSLLTEAQRRQVDEAVGAALAESPAVGESALNQTVLHGLRLGVGVHHAGILPSLKRLVERLFEQGLCKVVFATETMSLGIHMPARAVVLQGLTKRTERGFRSLTHNELIQMAGRAGRRGIDTEGTCVIALDARDGVEDVIRVVDGSPEPILSQFRLGYGSVALLVGSGAPPEALRRRVEASFGQYQNLKRLRELEAEVARVERALAEARGFPAPCGDLGHMERYRRLRQAAAERHARARGERGLWDVEPGRLLLLRQRGRPTLAMAVRVHTLRGRRALVDALLPHGALARVKGSAVKQVLWATPPLVVGQDRASDVRALRPLAAQLAALDVSELLARERARESASALGAVPCHRCPWTSTARCEQASREIERLAERVTLRRRTLDALRGAYWQEFLRVVEVLEQFGAIREGRLEPKGRLIAALRHDNELLVAEVVGRGLLDDLSLPEAAALCSTLSEDARSGEPRIARAFLRGRPRLRRRLEQVVAVAEAVAEAQRERRLTLPVSVHPGYMPAVYRWAAGDDDWPAIVADAFGGHEGDLIRAMRRLIDLLRQLAESGEVAPATARLLGQAARALDRGIVLESALI